MARKSRKNLPQPEQAMVSVQFPELDEEKIPTAIYGRLSVEDDEDNENVEVNLNRYLVTKDSDGKFVYNEDQSFKEQTTPTNAKGDYSFDDLPTNGYVTDPNDPTKRTQVIYAYAVSVKGLPSDYVVTKYHKGKDDARDSNIDPQDSQYTLKDKSLIVGSDVLVYWK